MRVRELLETHRLLEAARLLPEETLPRREVRPLEERVLEDPLDASKRLDHIRPVVVEVPQLAVVALVRPPERVVARHLELLEVLSHPPALVVRKGVAILLEERVDTRDPAVPTVLEILEREPPVLRVRFLPLQCVLGPHALGVDELALPSLDVAVQVRDELVRLVRHPGTEVCDARLGL